MLQSKPSEPQGTPLASASIGLGIAPRCHRVLQVVVARGVSVTEEILIRALAAKQLLPAGSLGFDSDDDPQLSAPFKDPKYSGRLPISCRRADGGIEIAIDTKLGEDAVSGVQSALHSNPALANRLAIEDLGPTMDIAVKESTFTPGLSRLQDNFPYLFFEPAALAAEPKRLETLYSVLAFGKWKQTNALGAFLKQYPELTAQVRRKVYQALTIAAPEKAQQLAKSIANVPSEDELVLAPRHIQEHDRLLTQYISEIWGGSREDCRRQLGTLVAPEAADSERKYYSSVSPYNSFLMHSIVPYGAFQWWQQKFSPISSLFQILHGDTVLLPERRMDEESYQLFGESVGYRGALMFEHGKWRTRGLEMLIGNLTNLITNRADASPRFPEFT